MNQTKVIARSALWNGLGQIAPAASAFFAIPILIAGLGVDRFGVLSLIWVVIGYVGLFDLGLGRALTQLVATKIGANDTKDLPALVWTTLVLMFGLGIVGGTAVALSASPLTNSVIKIPPPFREETITSFYLLAVSAPVITVTAALRGYLEAKQRFDMINQVRIPMGILTFVGPVLVLPFSATLPPIVAVLLLGRVIALGLHGLQCRWDDPTILQHRSTDRQLSRSLLQFGGWMTLSNVISPIMVNMDRFFVASLISVTAVSYYITPFEIVIKLLILPGALVGVLFPMFGTGFARDVACVRELYSRAIKWVALLLGPVVLAVAAFAKLGLTLWLKSPEFAEFSVRPLQILAVGVLMNGMAMIPFALIQGAGRPDVTAKMHLAELVIYLPLLYVLTVSYGINGVAVAWLVRVALDAALLYRYAAMLLLKRSATANELLATEPLRACSLAGDLPTRLGSRR